MMSEEWFDVVDERDEVTGRELRSEVHRLGLRHRAVHVLVWNSQGQIFLQKRSWTKDTYPGRWDSSASGHVDAGEGYDASAARELSEELGIGVEEAPRRLFKVEACEETGWEFVWVYRWESEGPFRLHPEEIEEGGWFDVSEVEAWLGRHPEAFAPAFRLIWRKGSVNA